jgi:hypothetical protein
MKHLKKLSLGLLLVLSSFTGIICGQEQELMKLVSIQTVNVNDMMNIALESASNEESESDNLILAKRIDQQSSESELVKKSIYFNAASVNIQKMNGYHFHVADYTDGTRIVTSLDGEIKGMQVVGYNGKLVVSSSNVEWQNNNFTHYYPAGKVISYPNQQILIVY